MIVGFKSEETRRVFYGLVSRRLPADIQSAARRKLRVLDAAVALADLRTPPGNRLEARKGSRAGQHSICINDQWRIRFVWREAGQAGSRPSANAEETQGGTSGSADSVETADYH